MIEVVRAKHDDIPWMLSQLQKFSGLVKTQKSLFEDNEETLKRLHLMVDQHVVMIAHDDGLRMGFICGMVWPHFFNPKIKVLAEMFWWVDEAYRNGRAGALLFKEFVAWGEANVDWITMSLEEQSPVNQTSIEKRGFKIYERSFLKEVG